MIAHRPDIVFGGRAENVRRIDLYTQRFTLMFGSTSSLMAHVTCFAGLRVVPGHAYHVWGTRTHRDGLTLIDDAEIVDLGRIYDPA